MRHRQLAPVTTALLVLTAALLVAGGAAATAGTAAATAPTVGSPPTAAVAVAPVPSASDRTLRNLEAFARLYGWVRWFHPSEEASQVDWDRLAVLGVERVAAAADDDGLRAALLELFSPVAPTLRLPRPGEAAPPLAPPPEPASRWQTIAWQHLGLGQGREPYASARLHRPRRQAAAEESAGFGTVTQAVPAHELRGKRVRLRAFVRTELADAGSAAQLWLRVDRPGGAMGFFDNMGDRPIRSAQWASYEISGPVAADAERVVFGGFLAGSGKAWLDGFELAVEEGTDWRPVPIQNAGFEAGEQPSGWNATSAGYSYTVAREGAREGKAALLIAQGVQLVNSPLFAAAPALGDVQEGELVSGIAARVPLAVPGDAQQTWPPGGEPFTRLQAALAKLNTGSWSGDDWRVRAADVVILWNVYEHFYPYFDVVDVDWRAMLREGLRRALGDADARAFLTTLKTMVAAVQDGHGNAYNPALGQGTSALPYWFDVVEGKVVVTAAGPGDALRRGDVLLAVDGEDALAQLRSREALRSGTPQWRRVSALWGIGSGPKEQPARVRIERDGATLELDVPRNTEPPQTDHALEPVAKLPGDVLYLDLTRLDGDALEAQLADLPKARAVVFDMRGYPGGGAKEVLQHLTDKPMQSAIWQVPQIIRPGHREPAGWDLGGRWDLPPLEPTFRGKVAFLTGPGAISYAESIMGIVEAYQLGAIVGSTTAGTNGNVNMVRLPGGYGFIFTGMRVLKHDGSRHHLVGIAPTVPVTRTLAGVRAGRDEELEAALRLLSAESP